MDKKHISQKVEAWIVEEDLPGNGTLKPIRKFDGLYPDNPEERDAWFDFIHWVTTREHDILLSIPKQDSSEDFWQMDEGDDAMSYAFGSADYQERLPEFNKYHYRIIKVLERVKDLAITHSCISNENGKKNTHNKFLNFVENEFQDQAKLLYETLKKYPEWVNKWMLLGRLAKLNSNIRKCKRVWAKYAYWE